MTILTVAKVSKILCTAKNKRKKSKIIGNLTVCLIVRCYIVPWLLLRIFTFAVDLSPAKICNKLKLGLNLPYNKKLVGFIYVAVPHRGDGAQLFI